MNNTKEKTMTKQNQNNKAINAILANGYIKIVLSILLVAIVYFVGITPTNTALALQAHQNNRGIALVDGETGILIYAENPDVVKEMASTTKIFTAYFAIEKCEKENIDMQALQTVKKQWTGIEGSSIYLQAEEQVSLEELLYGLMLRSGNDSAVAIAEIVFGSEEEYLKYANARLKELGFTKTYLQNPHGLPKENHHTTARELAQFSAFAMKNETFQKIVSAKSYVGGRTTYSNKNKILQTVEGGNGIKTGYTKSAGRCLVSSAKRDGNQVVLAVLNTYDMFERSKAHLDSFFNTHEYIDISNELAKHAVPVDIIGKTAKIALENGCTKVPIPKGEKVQIDIKTVKNVPFYTKSGTFAGKITISTPNRLIFEGKLYIVESCDRI